MTWRIGIDEAGYGPNLGPLVMTAVACQVPSELADADLWTVLQSAVRRRRCAGDVRLYVDDSKLVYSSARGLDDLEAAVLSVLGATQPAAEGVFSTLQTLSQIVDVLCWEGGAGIRRETWFRGNLTLPTAAAADRVQKSLQCLLDALRHCGVRWGPVCCRIVCPAQFNDIVDHWGSKGAVLAIGMTDLLRWQLSRTQNGPVQVVIDKHGGRNHYSALVQEAVSPGMVVAREEAMARSVYEVLGLERPVRLTFMPRADAGDFCVALASMMSKYLRELFMAEFNAFWLNEVPDLEPTAGYPGDAARFFAAIAPARQRLGIPDRLLWRAR